MRQNKRMVSYATSEFVPGRTERAELVATAGFPYCSIMDARRSEKRLFIPSSKTSSLAAANRDLILRLSIWEPDGIFNSGSHSGPENVLSSALRLVSLNRWEYKVLT